MPLRWRSIVTAKILNLKFLNFFSIKLIFFYKTDDLRLAFLHMWVKYELIQMSFSAKNIFFMFSEIFSILIPIVTQKSVLQISFFFIMFHMIAIHHCAKEQLAWLDIVQIRAPYCTLHLQLCTLAVMYSMYTAPPVV